MSNRNHIRVPASTIHSSGRAAALFAQLEIVSGGQTGVDRAALDAAREWRLPYGGWVPKGRTAEDGPIPLAYENLRETDEESYEARTRRNIEESDATLVLINSSAIGGTKYTIEYAQAIAKPLLIIDTSEVLVAKALNMVLPWLQRYNVDRLNVAGPRASEYSGGYLYAYTLVSLIAASLQQRATAIEHHQLALALLAESSSNFRHWDQLRWTVPAWFLSLATAIVGILPQLTSFTPSAVAQLQAAVGVFGALCIRLQINLISYHERMFCSMHKNLDLLTLDGRAREVLKTRLPFSFGSFRSFQFFKTATSWFLLATFVVTAWCILAFLSWALSAFQAKFPGLP